MQDLDDVVNLQAGVVDGHFRGGRTGEVQYQVDGVSVNNAFDNSSSLKLDRSLLQEVQVISGTFDAEYGQAMSGVVNAVLKQGTEYVPGRSGEVYGGGFFFPGREEERRTDDTPHLTGTAEPPGERQRAAPRPRHDLPGQRPPLPLRRLRLRPRRVFKPTDDVADSAGTAARSCATGDGERDAPGLQRRVVRRRSSSPTTRLASTKLNYQAIFNWREGRPQNYSFRYHAGRPVDAAIASSITHGFDVTHTLNADHVPRPQRAPELLRLHGPRSSRTLYDRRATTTRPSSTTPGPTATTSTRACS